MFSLMRRIRVGARFAVAFGVILALTLLTGTVAFIGSSQQSKTLQETRNASALVKYVDQQRYFDADISAWQNAYAWDTYRIGAAAALSSNNPNRAAYLSDRTDLVDSLKSAPTDLMTADERAINERLIALWDQFIDFDNRAVVAFGDGRTADAEAHILEGGAPVYRQILAEMDDLEQSVNERSAAAQAHAARVATLARGFIVGFAVLAVVFVALMLIALVRTVVVPLRELTQRADEVASERLPEAISLVRSQPADATAPKLPAFTVTSKDELADLAVAFNHVQDSALDLAVEQHRSDRAAAEMLVNLGRRNQNLLSRTLAFLADLERNERDPQVLEKLFRLDHLSTRIRRNAESMLVLAGAQQTRAKTRPVKASSVVRAALAEIEDYPRVDLDQLDEVTLHGSATADVTHLLAELLENATAFSPSTTRVQVTALAQLDGGYRITISDSGVGMSDDELVIANERIAAASTTRPDSPLLGHHVVGLLADRWAMSVSLAKGRTAGLVVTVDLPASLIVQARVDAPVGLTADRSATQAEVSAPVEAIAEPAPVTPPTVPVAEPALVAAVQAVQQSVQQSVQQAVQQVAPVQTPLRAAAPVRPAAADEISPVMVQPPARVRGAQLGELGRDLGRTADEARGPQVATLPAPVAPPAAAPATPPVVPTRVRGAQLPDTGEDAFTSAGTSKSAEQVRRGLSGLQSGVSRARQDSAANPAQHTAQNPDQTTDTPLESE